VDRDAIAREGRRREAIEALGFEREREAALRAQVAETVLEEEGPRVDREAFARLSEADVAVVRDALGRLEEDDPAEDDPFADPDGYISFADEPEGEETDELGRLQAEIAMCRERQGALERYIAALETPPPPDAG
jgi:hypothetical protein